MKYIGNGLCESGQSGLNKYFIIGMEVKSSTEEVNVCWGKIPYLLKYRFKLINIVTGKILEVDASSYATRKEHNGVENYIDIKFEEETK
jgi:hypothetical protein|nr:MAG TPA: hypothetical protein [Caudoviricetes sp.]